MGIFKSDGTRVTRATFPTTAVPAADTPKVLTENLKSRKRYGDSDPSVDGSIRGEGLQAGTVLTQRQIDALFPGASVDSVTPKQGPAAGGTVVTLRGQFLDGVTQVKFGTVNGTALTRVSDKVLRVTAPAVAAGTVNLVLSDDSGTTTLTGAYKYV